MSLHAISYDKIIPFAVYPAADSKYFSVGEKTQKLPGGSQSPSTTSSFEPIQSTLQMASQPLKPFLHGSRT